MSNPLADTVAGVKKWVAANPGKAVIASNAATAGVFLYILAQRYGGVIPAVTEAVFGAVASVSSAHYGGKSNTSKFRLSPRLLAVPSTPRWRRLRRRLRMQSWEKTWPSGLMLSCRRKPSHLLTFWHSWSAPLLG